LIKLNPISFGYNQLQYQYFLKMEKQYMCSFHVSSEQISSFLYTIQHCFMQTIILTEILCLKKCAFHALVTVLIVM